MFRKKFRIHKVNEDGRKTKKRHGRRPKLHRCKNGRKKHFQIIREITWPSFPSALIQTFGCIIAVAALAGAVWVYDYGINQGITKIISLLS